MHGSPKNVNINGIEFVPTADCDMTINVNEWDNSVEPNGSGPGSIQSVRKVPGVENLTLRTDATEVGFLRTWSDSGEWVDFYTTLKDGAVYSCKGLLVIDSFSTAKGTSTIKIQCRTGWDIAAA